MRTLLGLLFAASAFAATPVLLFSNLTDGPRTGGENGKGAYVCVTGRNFGATQGTSTIQIGSGGTWVNVDNYPIWGSGNAIARGDDKACFQLGTSVPTGAQNIRMVTAGGTSGTLPFYVRVGGFNPTAADGLDAIYCVSDTALPTSGGTTPSNSNDGHFGTTPLHGCWSTMAYAIANAPVSALLYVHNVDIGSTNGAYAIDTGIGGLAANFHGVANAHFGFLGYPGSTGQIGTYSHGDGLNGPQGMKLQTSYVTIANLKFWAFTFAFSWTGPADLTPITNFRVVGNDFKCESTAGGSACAPSGRSRNFVFYGNLFHDMARDTPNAYMPTAAGISPYDETDAVISSLTSDGAGNCTMHLVGSPGNVTIGEGVGGSGATIYLMNAPDGVPAYPFGAFSGPIGKVTAKDAHSFTFDCPSAPANSTWDQTTNPKMWYSGRHKFHHTLYFGSMVTDYEAAWNEFARNYLNIEIFAHSTQLNTPNPNNPSAIGYWAVPAPILPSAIQQVAFPKLNTTTGCTSGTCASDHTYYVAFSWQGNGGESQGSHETAYTIPAGQRLTVTSPAFWVGTGVSTPCFLTYEDCTTTTYSDRVTPTGFCVYVGTTPGGSKQQACSTTDGGTWTEPTSGITTSGTSRLTWLTQSIGWLGGLAGTHIRVHDNYIHDGASEGMRFTAADPTPSGMYGDDDTPGGVYIYNNIIARQAKYPFIPATVSEQTVQIYNQRDPGGSANCINIMSSTHAGPTPVGVTHIENNTCYDINSGGTPDASQWGAMIGANGYNGYQLFDGSYAGNASCANIVQANNNIFVAAASAANIPWVNALSYTFHDCINSLKGQKNVWWSTVDNTRKPPDAATLNGNASCVVGGRNAGTSCFTANISADPKFANPATGDFSLLAGSPAIAAGINTTPATDYFGNPRTLGAYSLGAIEVVSAGGGGASAGGITGTFTGKR